ncbi:hypothetical protein L1987_56448 [Smallanthus sonchifolius]|uniref:Uncharacterized protein n=1 Tax=Smallanthus sonchifolius TaxID=185202 RepID=A0ACB9EDV1_9ASTR|nr:hypothetical protein L1987_56448 [Smallanthus sonchifolius]
MIIGALLQLAFIWNLEESHGSAFPSFRRTLGGQNFGGNQLTAGRYVTFCSSQQKSFSGVNSILNHLIFQNFAVSLSTVSNLLVRSSRFWANVTSPAKL